jgi:hypothetical protein
MEDLTTLINMWGATSGSNMKPRRDYFITCQAQLAIAGKFNLGDFTFDDVKQLGATGQNMFEEGLGQLPFDISYFECSMNGQLAAAIVWNDGAGAISATPFICGAKIPEYGLGNVPILYKVTLTVEDGELAYRRSGLVGEPEPDEAINNLIDKSVYLVLVAMALLASDAVEVAEVAAPKRLNKRRLKKGKVPLYDHHVVKIKGVSKSGGIIPLGGTHASPRQHWRRGHIRTLHRDTLEEKKIMIPATLIGGRGFVSKDYEVVT